MKTGPGFFGGLVTASGNWQLDFDQETLTLTRPGHPPITILLDSATEVTTESGVIWAQLTITSSTQRIACTGLTNGMAMRFVNALRSAVATALIASIRRSESTLEGLAADVQRLLGRPSYLAQRDLDLWKEACAANAASLQLLTLISNPLLSHDDLPEGIRAQVDAIIDVLSTKSARIKARNERFVEEEIARHRAYFNSVERNPRTGEPRALTREQCVASVVMEDRNLLLAAAGSGKTSTLVGKIGYAVRVGHCAPSDILVLAFNKSTAADLDRRINLSLRQGLPEGERVRAETFHALGLEVIAQAAGTRPSVVNGGQPLDAGFIEQLIRERLAQDEAFGNDWVTFRALCFMAAPNPADFKSLADWDRANRKALRTLQGEIVKSQGELAIANWLCMHGVAYEYERPYEHDTATPQRGQYKPDFYLPAIDTWLEHFAVDKDGHTPPWPGYADGMRWKTQLHADMSTQLLTTTFAEFASGALFPRLEIELRQRGQRLRPPATAAVLARLSEIKSQDSYCPLLSTLLKHAKSNEVDELTALSRATLNPQPYRAGVFVRVFWKLLNAYENLLRETGEVDFEDMILTAARLVTDGRYRHPYKLILVDELQDISQSRAKLLKALLAQAPNCKLFAVGDDWQSIYRFAGSDIDVITSFQDHFGATAVNHLTETFRSNQGISDVAAAFVQKNPRQTQRRVRAKDSASREVVVVRFYDAAEGMAAACEATLAEIAGIASPGERRTVYILARYNHLRPSKLAVWTKSFGSLSIEFLTIHSSKGREADYVVVLGLQAGASAFPSEINDDPLLQLVMPEPEAFPNAEERRLFYVALTRARHRVYLLGCAALPSTFLAEIAGDPSFQPILRRAHHELLAVEVCPLCNEGTLRTRKGKFGDFLGCSSYPRCRYTRSMEEGWG